MEDETQARTEDVPSGDDTDEDETAGSSSLCPFVFFDVDSLVQTGFIRTNIDCLVFD
jgi:hypothetical protein